MYEPLTVMEEFKKNCYKIKLEDKLPIEKAWPIMQMLYKEKEISIHMTTLYLLLSKWRSNKEVYRFDEELEKSFIEMKDFSPPVEIFKYMPYPCIYIELSKGNVFRELGMHGFFAYIDCSLPGAHYLHISRVRMGGKESARLTLELTYDASVSEIIKSAGLKGDLMGDEIERFIFFALQCLMYLCAKNAEISENPEQAKVYRPGAEIKDKYREIRKWDVGIRYGRAVRKAIANENQTEEIHSAGNRNRPRPHMRRAHWQHYWTGRGRKELILKWISTFGVNIESTEELPATIKEVK
jgi:hypothetical protein